MTILTIHQIKFTYEEYHSANSEVQRIVQAKANVHRKLSCIRDDDVQFTDEMQQQFDHVADIVCDTLEDAFRISNNPLADDEDKIIRHRPMHSLSVGDVVTNRETGEAWLCKAFGWQQISWNWEMSVEKSQERNAEDDAREQMICRAMNYAETYYEDGFDFMAECYGYTDWRDLVLDQDEKLRDWEEIRRDMIVKAFDRTVKKCEIQAA